MNPVSVESDGAAILYDADLFGKIEASFFEPAYWRARGAVTGEARGRGTAWFVRHDGHELVLRHYRRGGMLGPWFGDRYLWLGFARARAVREWRLLDALYRRGLPVPRPVAARVQRRGLIYRADLLTQRIAQAQSLAELLTRAPLARTHWDVVGRCLRRLHDAGACHADLNAHNILLADEQVYIVDFDRGRLRAPGRWAARNLARLQRSLAKLARERTPFHCAATDWTALLDGYTATGSPSGRHGSAGRSA